MQALVFVLSIVLGFGLLLYNGLLWISKKDWLEPEEINSIEDLLETINMADMGTKVKILFVLGGAFLTETVVKLIELPFLIVQSLMQKKST